MIEELKKKSFKRSLPFAVVLIVAGLVLAVWNAGSAFYAVAGLAQFEKLKPEKVKNQLVKMDLDVVYECYLESGTKDTSTGRKTINYYWYIIATGDDFSTDRRYIALKVPKKAAGDVDDIMEYNYEYGLPVSEPVELMGKVKKLSGKYYDYFHDFFVEDNDWSEEEFQDAVIPYYIDVNLSMSFFKYLYVILFVGGVALVLWGVLRIVNGARGKLLKDFTKDYESIGLTEASVESDMASAASFTKSGDVKVGRLCTYWMSGAAPRAIPNSKILWCYQNTTTHRTNGIKTGTTYSVMVFVDGNKTAFDISVPNEAAAQDVLKRIGDTLPWVVVGYSEDLRKMFNKDRAGFLQLRYNTVEHIAVEPGFEGFQPQSGT